MTKFSIHKYLILALLIPGSSFAQGIALSSDFTNEFFLTEQEFFEVLDTSNSDYYLSRFEHTFKLIISKDKKLEFENLSSLEDKKNYIKTYVQYENKNPIYPVNYWLLEYLGRIQTVFKNYGSENFPYFDVRGEYYIQYGKPFRKFVDFGGYKKSSVLSAKLVYSEGDLGEVMYGRNLPKYNFYVYPNESWEYVSKTNNFVVHFIKKDEFFVSHDLLEALKDTRDRDVAWQWMELILERGTILSEYMAASSFAENFITSLTSLSVITPSSIINEIASYSSIAPHQGIMSEKSYYDNNEKYKNSKKQTDLNARFDDVNVLDFSYSFASFKGDLGKSKIEITVLTPIKETINQRIGNPPDTMSIEYTLVLRNEKFVTVSNLNFINSLPLDYYKKENIKNMITQFTFLSEPISGDNTLQLKDTYNERIGFDKTDMVIKDYSGDGIMLSDIIIYTKDMNLGKNYVYPEKKIENVVVNLYPYKEITKMNPFLIYFEMYNLSNIMNSYQIEITLQKEVNDKSLGELAWEKLTGNQDYNVSMNFIENVTSNDQKKLMEIDINKLKKGNYRLIINLVDNNGNLVFASTEKEFTLK